MWKEIVSPVRRRNGTAVISTTETFASGTRILQIHAFASSIAGSVQIFNDPIPVTLPANSGWWGIQENHNSLIAPGAAGGAGGTTIVFTTVAAYVIEYLDTEGSGG